VLNSCCGFSLYPADTHSIQINATYNLKWPPQSPLLTRDLSKQAGVTIHQTFSKSNFQLLEVNNLLIPKSTG